MGTQKLVSWTSNSCTVLFISAILAVSVTITVETGRNTEGILTAKLTNMARWKIWNCNKTSILIETTNKAISTTFFNKQCKHNNNQNDDESSNRDQRLSEQ